MHNWQGDPVNSGSEYVVARVKTTNQELRNATNQSLSYIGFTLSAVDVIVLLTGWPVSSACWCLIDMVTLAAMGVNVLLTGSPCQQWRLMYYWHGDPVSSGCWCLIDKVTLAAMGVNFLLTGSPCQQWRLMYYWHGDPFSSGCWCLIDRVTLSAVGVHVIVYLVHGW